MFDALGANTYNLESAMVRDASLAKTENVQIAMEIIDRAVDCDFHGDKRQAVILYQKAYGLCPDIDDFFRQKQRQADRWYKSREREYKRMHPSRQRLAAESAGCNSEDKYLAHIKYRSWKVAFSSLRERVGDNLNPNDWKAKCDEVIKLWQSSKERDEILKRLG